MTRRILLLNIAELIDMGRLPLTEFIPVVRWPLFQWVSKPSQEALVFPTEDVDGCFIPGECYSHDQVVTDALVNKKCKILAMIFAELGAKLVLVERENCRSSMMVSGISRTQPEFARERRALILVCSRLWSSVAAALRAVLLVSHCPASHSRSDSACCNSCSA